MKIRVIGGGWYGCHIASTLIGRVKIPSGMLIGGVPPDIADLEKLLEPQFDVELHEQRECLFGGASGANPARLHLGFHYPRSKATRELSQVNYRTFMAHYGGLTRGVPVNIYAVAAGDSLVDFGNYVDTLRPEVDFVRIHKPEEFGIQNVEGAVLTGERHILVNKVREHFEKKLDGHVRYGVEPGDIDDPGWDVTIDCTFCALDRAGVDRYEPCVMYLFTGNYDKAVTIMDGPFPSFYPHYENRVASLTSAKYTPLARCKTWEEAQAVIEDTTAQELAERREALVASMCHYYPAFRDLYEYADTVLSVRAMPLSGADSRLYEVTRGPRSLRVRAGKIDAVFSAAENVVAELKRWSA